MLVLVGKEVRDGETFKTKISTCDYKRLQGFCPVIGLNRYYMWIKLCTVKYDQSLTGSKVGHSNAAASWLRKNSSGV